MAALIGFESSLNEMLNDYLMRATFSSGSDAAAIMVRRFRLLLAFQMGEGVDDVSSSFSALSKMSVSTMEPLELPNDTLFIRPEREIRREQETRNEWMKRTRCI